VCSLIEPKTKKIAGMEVPDYRNQVVDAGELARWSQVLDENNVPPNARRAARRSSSSPKAAPAPIRAVKRMRG
jgi:hypothetical protein